MLYNIMLFNMVNSIITIVLAAYVVVTIARKPAKQQKIDEDLEKAYRNGINTGRDVWRNTDELRLALRNLKAVQAGWAFGVPEDGREQWLDLVIEATRR